MLKACLDCIAGDQRQSEDPYSVHLNGGSRAPPWPLQNQNMTQYLVPTRLNQGNSFVIVGQINEDRLNVTLGGDRGTAFSLDVYVSSDQIVLSPSDDSEYRTSDYFPDSNFVLEFQILDGGIRIMVGDSKLSTIRLNDGWLEDFRYISVNCNVRELIFRF